MCLYNNLIGKRICCIYMYDVFDSTGKKDEAATSMKGVCGTVKKIDDIGQIHVQWDNGSTLALDPKKDEFTVID